MKLTDETRREYLNIIESKLEREKAELKKLSLESGSSKKHWSIKQRISILEGIIKNMKEKLGYGKQITFLEGANINE